MRNQMGREFVEAIEAAPIVAAVKDDSGLEMCLTSDVDAVFILYGDICRRIPARSPWCTWI